MASPAGPSSVIRFGAFELDTVNRELRKAGVSLKIHPQPLQVLLLLAEHAGQVVTREEIQHCLWRDNTFVDFERGINFCINQIRTALGDDAEKPRYVETLPRRGYRFIATVAMDIAPDSPAADQPISEQPPGEAPDLGTDQRLNAVAVPAGEPVTRLHSPTPAPTRKRRYFLVALGLATMMAAAVGGLFLSRKAHALTDKDTIVLADFTNTTGDAVFDGTLRQGLAVQLEQSPFLSLISDERIRQTLRLMDQPAGAKLTAEIGREICQRTTSAAVLSGSIVNLGNQYVLGLEAVNCRTGDTLAEEQETANGKEQVLGALSQAATKLRGKLGESLKSIEKYDAPLEQATTPSLAALQAYSLGRKTFLAGDPAGAIPPLQRAIQLDPNFAQAYLMLGVSYANTGEFGRAEENMSKAYERQQRASERERLFIEAQYSALVMGDLEKARQIDEVWTQTYSRDSLPFANLGSVYYLLGQHDRAVVAFQQALRLEPDASLRYLHLAGASAKLNHLKEARALIEEAQAKKLDSPDLHISLYLMAFVENDRTAMEREVAWSAGRPGYEDVLLNLEAGMFAYQGKVKKSRELTDRITTLAARAQRKDTAAVNEAAQAITEALFGNDVEARKRAATALKLSSNRHVQNGVVATEALLGDTARAQAFADGLEKRFPDDTLLQNSLLPMIRAQLALSRNDSQTAINILQRAKPYELSDTDGLASAFLRGNAYVAAHRATEAAAEFQRVLDHPAIVLLSPWGALAHLGLARAYALQGDTAKAKAAYDDFFALWKDADPDVPILNQAKAEYAKLK
jgi:DNA-binding winged helix-turn-helix (wHTH) protein/tetratricopeptide (TPR) repeat protein